MKMSDAEYAEWRAAIAADREGRAMSDATDVAGALRRVLVVCEDTATEAVDGACPLHHGDACLVVIENPEYAAERAVVSAAIERRKAQVEFETEGGPRQPRIDKWGEATRVENAAVDALLSLRGEDG